MGHYLEAMDTGEMRQRARTWIADAIKLHNKRRYDEATSAAAIGQGYATIALLNDVTWAARSNAAEGMRSFPA